jgi:hypothetical protein
MRRSWSGVVCVEAGGWMEEELGTWAAASMPLRRNGSKGARVRVDMGVSRLQDSYGGDGAAMSLERDFGF